MPAIGDKAYGGEIGHYRSSLYLWHACELCRKERWVITVFGKPKHLRCHRCSLMGRKASAVTKEKQSESQKRRFAVMGSHPNWKGGRQRHIAGYILVWLPKDSFFYQMASPKSYVMEHRLIMAQSIGRILHFWETVHHKNGIKDDNRIENLQLLSSDFHHQLTRMEVKIKRLQLYIATLKEKLAAKKI